MPDQITKFPIATVPVETVISEMTEYVSQASAFAAASKNHADRADLAAGEVMLEPDAMQIMVTSDHQPYETVAQRALVQEVLSDIHSLRTAATFHLGDLVHLGDMNPVPEETLDGVTFNDYMEYLYDSGQNMQTFFPIAGNHDIEGYLSASPTTRGTGKAFYDRFRRPPVYAITNGNMAYVFCGYETRGVFQQNSNTVLDTLEKILEQFQNSHNIFLFTHAPLLQSMLFDYNPSTDWFRLKPEDRWLSIFNTYKIDAHFCGHSATDIISADETTIKTYTSRTGTSGHLTHHILTGPHIERRHWNANHKLGGRTIFLTKDSSTVVVRMRDHQAKAWVDAKGINIQVRFPVKLNSVFEDKSIELKTPLIRGPLRILNGVGEGNESGTAWVQKRRFGLVSEWKDTFGGDVPEGAEHLIKIVGPNNNISTDGPSVMIGVSRLIDDDDNNRGGLVIYGSDQAGDEKLIVCENKLGQILFRDNYYPTSKLYPMWSVSYQGNMAAPAVDPYSVIYTNSQYDDFTMVNINTGVMTCAHPGVYDVTACVQINGNATAFEDVVSLRLVRTRGSQITYYGVSSYTLQGGNANSRQTLWCHNKIGLLIDDTVEFQVVGWSATNKNTLVSATFSGTMVRGV